MTMRGEFGTFSAAEILQLIASQEKSGVLQVGSKGRSAVLFFDSGKIISARDRRRSTSDPFLTYLLENGEISIQDLHKVIDAKKDQGGDVIEIMLRANMVDDAKLGDWLSRYAQRIVANMVKWETGTYEFAASCDGMPDKCLGKPLRLEPILMEALRRKDEVDEIRRFLPGLETRLQITEPDYRSLPLEQDDITILKLVDSERTIDQIIEESSLEEVETLDALEKLFALGIIAIAAEAPRADRARTVTAARSALVVCIALAAAVGLRLSILSPGNPHNSPAGAVRSAITEFVEVREIANLRFALDAYREINGSYPESLQELVSAKLVAPNEIRDRYGKELSYRRLPAKGSYILSS